MLVPFDQLPDDARIWIYQSNRKFSEEETQDISQKIAFFYRSGQRMEPI